MKSLQVSVVIPAYNEEICIADVIHEVQSVLREYVHEVIVVDDGSTDGTAERAREAGALIVSHHQNRGYGSSLKMGIRRACYEWVIIMDSDGQHRSEDVLLLLQTLEKSYDTVVGARDRSSFQYAARMPGKRFLQWLAGYLVGERPPDVNSGLRVFRREDVLRYFPILPNGFSFTTTITLAMLKDGYEIAWVPIQVRPRQGRRSNVKIKDGLRTLMLIMRIAMLFNPLKIFLPISIVLFSIGLFYGIFNVIREFNIPDGAELLMVAGLIVFFFGVLADQLASIRRGG